MERDPIDQLRFVIDYVDGHKDDAECVALSRLIRGKLHSLFFRVQQAVRIAAQAAGLNTAEILQKAPNYQKLAGHAQSTIVLGKETERPIIEHANQQVVEGAGAILLEARAKYEAIMNAAIQAADKAATTEADDGRDADYDEQGDAGDDDQRRVAS